MQNKGHCAMQCAHHPLPSQICHLVSMATCTFSMISALLRPAMLQFMGAHCPTPMQWSPCCTYLAFCVYYKYGQDYCELHVLNQDLESISKLPPGPHIYRQGASISAWLQQGLLVAVLQRESCSSIHCVFPAGQHCLDSTSSHGLHLAEDLLADMSPDQAVHGLACHLLGGFAVLTGAHIPAGQYLAGGHQDCHLHVQAGAEMLSIKLACPPEAQLTWSPTGRHLMVLAKDYLQLVHRTDTALSLHGLAARGPAAFSPDGRHVAAVQGPDSSRQHAVVLYHAGNGSLACSVAQSTVMQSLAFAAQGDALLLGSCGAVSIVLFGQPSSASAYNALCDMVSAAADEQSRPIGSAADQNADTGLSLTFIEDMRSFAAAMQRAEAASGDDDDGADAVDDA